MEKTRCLVFDDASHQVCRRQCGTLRSIVEDCIANEPLVALLRYEQWTNGKIYACLPLLRISTQRTSSRKLPLTQALPNSSRYWLVRSTTMSSSDFNSRPRTFSAFPALETPGFDFLVPLAGNLPDAMASGNFSAAILGTSSQVMSVSVSDFDLPLIVLV